MNKLMKKQKGITLIALVVTIIVLLILAGISIMMLTGQSGILNQARAAKEDTRGGEVKDEVALAVSENTMAEYTGNGTRKSRQEVIDQLYKEGKLTDDEVTWLEENDQITIGSIEIDFSALGETTEKIEYMYYLTGEYNNATKRIENIRLSFFPEIRQKIVRENLDEFKMTEEELVFKGATEEGYTWNATTFEEYMQAIYEETPKVSEKYTKAREFLMNTYYGYNHGLTEEEYKEHINMLRAWFDKEEKMTEEELVLKAAVDHFEYTKAETFDKYMEELYNVKKYKTAKDFLEGYYNVTEEQYNKIIQQLRERYEGKQDITIEDSFGRDWMYYIEKPGSYEFTPKLDGKELKKFTINIDQYEIINDYSLQQGDNWYNGVLAYDFKNGKVLTIDSGEYIYYGETLDKQEYSGEINNSELISMDEAGNFIAKKPHREGIYEFKLKSDKNEINGYVSWYDPTSE